MAIDWFTTGAQIFNFLILVWLLKKLLFRPIIGAMERREQGLSSRLQQAKVKMSEAEAQKNQYQQQIHQLQTDKDEVLLQVRQQAEAEKSALLQQLGEEIQQKKTQFTDEMRQEQEEQGQLISRLLAEKSLKLSQKILSQLADQTLEQRIIEHFLKNLSDLSEAEQTSIRNSLKQDSPGIIITSFAADEAIRLQVQTWFDHFAPRAKLLFEQHDYLICGCALQANGRSWEWNIDRYLTELGSELIKTSGQAS